MRGRNTVWTSSAIGIIIFLNTHAFVHFALGPAHFKRATNLASSSLKILEDHQPGSAKSSPEESVLRSFNLMYGNENISTASTRFHLMPQMMIINLGFLCLLNLHCNAVTRLGKYHVVGISLEKVVRTFNVEKVVSAIETNIIKKSTKPPRRKEYPGLHQKLHMSSNMKWTRRQNLFWKPALVLKNVFSLGSK